MKVILTEEVDDFMWKLDTKAHSKVRKRVDLLEEYGHILRMPHSRYIMPSVFELRTVGRDNIRLIYTYRDRDAIIFHAFIKKTGSLSDHEMNIIRQKFNNLPL